jgi:hypothetical protein
MSEERLELVVSERDLKAADLCVLRMCTDCGKDERMFLLRATTCECGCGRSAWLVDGGCHAQFVPDGSVREQRLYRVIIPPAEEARETSRPKKLERVR